MKRQYAIYFADKEHDGRQGVIYKINTDFLSNSKVKAISISCDENGVLLLYRGPNPEGFF
jgi:hypothetical protein